MENTAWPLRALIFFAFSFSSSSAQGHQATAVITQLPRAPQAASPKCSAACIHRVGCATPYMPHGPTLPPIHPPHGPTLRPIHPPQPDAWQAMPDLGCNTHHATHPHPEQRTAPQQSRSPGQRRGPWGPGRWRRGRTAPGTRRQSRRRCPAGGAAMHGHCTGTCAELQGPMANAACGLALLAANCRQPAGPPGLPVCSGTSRRADRKWRPSSCGML